jgi:23S rRNA maturation mini-RNase III
MPYFDNFDDDDKQYGAIAKAYTKDGILTVNIHSSYLAHNRAIQLQNKVKENVSQEQQQYEYIRRTATYNHTHNIPRRSRNEPFVSPCISSPADRKVRRMPARDTNQ